MLVNIMNFKKSDIFATAKKLKILSILAIFLLSSCSMPRDPVTGKIKNMEPNLKKRAEQFRDKQGSIFSTGRLGSGGTTYEFASSNPLWRASLKTLDFIPIQSANYSGGILVTDWYSKKNQQDSIKIEIRFLSTEVTVNSINVISYKRSCVQMNCEVTKLNNEFNNEIKNKILAEARAILIEKEKEKK